VGSALAGPGTQAQKEPADQRPPAGARTVVEESAVMRAREEAKYLRRLEVCDRLREIAEDTNNPNLRRRAEELKVRAGDLYKKRTARVPAAPPERPVPTRHQGMPAPGGPEHRPQPDLFTVPSSTSRAAAQEEK
jgi:hypothetical protein